MEVVINNLQQRVRYDERLEELIREAANRVLVNERVHSSAEVSVVLVDDEGIRELNRQYRGMDAPTDVLSFSMMERGEGEPELRLGPAEYMLGDVVISLERAARQAEDFGHSLERELAYLVAHGVLHLLGYSDDTEDGETLMNRKQEEVMEALGLVRER